ncbi:hypothetical protein PR048_003118 [Dryococelus australis]|uniref:Uncharacterized protein n=1 Tax=Dryococelus australis TaxID=614101 RepID=A0ABQ9IM33_9NEOP|nr:hypothetical protein PR048_003118 [Dryococelus australis]
MAAEEIHQSLNDVFLPKFNNLNKYFQNSKVIMIELLQKMVNGYKDLFILYMQTKVNDVDQNNISKYCADNPMYLEVEIMKVLLRTEIQNNHDCVKDFYLMCRNFLRTGCSELKKMYSFSDDLLSIPSLLMPKKHF